MQRDTWTRIAQLIVVLLSALTLKLCYSMASPNELRWILAPTTVLVELVSGTAFKFESHAGYISSDRSFVIAASCAGVNFLITSFLMLSLRKLWRDRSPNRSQNRSYNPSNNVAWRFIPVAALSAYLATLIANTVRIATALRLQRMYLETSWLSGNQLHRFEGIFIYFGFLLLLFMVSERSWENASDLRSFPSDAGGFPAGTDRNVCPTSHEEPGLPSHAGCPHGNSGLFRQSLFPLIYYATVLRIPLANGAYRTGTVATDFWEHSVFVLLTPLLLIVPLATFRLFRSYRNQWAAVSARLIRSDTERNQQPNQGASTRTIRLLLSFRKGTCAPAGRTRRPWA
jgi:exosortase K